MLPQSPWLPALTSEPGSIDTFGNEMGGIYIEA